MSEETQPVTYPVMVRESAGADVALKLAQFAAWLTVKAEATQADVGRLAGSEGKTYAKTLQPYADTYREVLAEFKAVFAATAGQADEEQARGS